MPETAGQAVLTILRRARDPEGLATSIDDARDLLSRAQQMLNLGLQAVVAETTLATDPMRQVYPLVLMPTVGRVVGVREDGRDLSRANWSWLRLIDRGWSRAVGEQFELWAPMGRTQLLIHPAKPVASTVTVISVTLTATLTDPTSPLDLPEELLPPLYDIVEAMLLLKFRKLASATDLQTRVVTRVQVLRRGGVV